MIITSNEHNQPNWYMVVHLVHGFKYSFSGYDYSLDESLRNTGIVTVKPASCSAEQVINKIGEDAFKAMIENIWNAEYYRRRIDKSHKLAEIVQGFTWNKTPQGSRYWSGVRAKLMELTKELG